MDGSVNAAIGNETESDAVELLSSFSCVQNAWRDLNNSKFDIYYILHGENLVRGLQVKSIMKSKSNDRLYYMKHLDLYMNGMLIIGLNKREQIGLAYINEDKYHKSTANMRINAPRGGIFSKLLMRWEFFTKSLVNLLSSGIILTEDVFRASIAPKMLMSTDSTQRLSIFANKYGFAFKVNEDTSSRTDVIFEGMRAQLKYASMPINVKNKSYAYAICLASRRNGSYKPYQKGDNDIYIIELGAHHGDFLFLSEALLIARGYIGTENQIGLTSLHVFPYDYIENSTMPVSKFTPIRGNWTCNKSLWLSTAKGEIK